MDVGSFRTFEKQVGDRIRCLAYVSWMLLNEMVRMDETLERVLGYTVATTVHVFLKERRSQDSYVNASAWGTCRVSIST